MGARPPQVESACGGRSASEQGGLRADADPRRVSVPPRSICSHPRSGDGAERLRAGRRGARVSGGNGASGRDAEPTETRGQLTGSRTAIGQRSLDAARRDRRTRRKTIRRARRPAPRRSEQLKTMLGAEGEADACATDASFEALSARPGGRSCCEAAGCLSRRVRPQLSHLAVDLSAARFPTGRERQGRAKARRLWWAPVRRGPRAACRSFCAGARGDVAQG